MWQHPFYETQNTRAQTSLSRHASFSSTSQSPSFPFENTSDYGDIEPNRMDKPKTRKPHKKSRNGCVPCKTRHIKCDEQRPQCLNCDKYGAKCEYPVHKKRRVASEDSPQPISISTPSSLEGAILNQIIADTSLRSTTQNLTLNISQLQLLHHFTTVTSKTLAADANGGEVYATYVIQIAFKFSFLLHAILALAALHLSRLDGSLKNEYLLQAGRHYDAALVEFRSEINDVDQTNFQAVLIFAKFQFPYGWATTVDTEDSLDHAFDRILSNIVLTRRVRPIVTTHYEQMRLSELGRLIPDDVQNMDWARATVPKEREVAQLRKFSDLVQHLYPPDIIEAYTEAITSLQRIFSAKHESDYPPSDALLTVFIHHVTPRFMELLSEKQPGALIIFSYYAVLLGRSQHYWFLEGVADQIITITDMFVPLEWKSWLDWPKEQIRGNAQ